MRCHDTNKPYKHKVQYTLKFVSSIGEFYDVSKKGTGKFSSEDPGSGSSELFVMMDVTDKKKGLVTDGVVKVKVDAEYIDE